MNKSNHPVCGLGENRCDLMNNGLLHNRVVDRQWGRCESMVLFENYASSSCSAFNSITFLSGSII